MAGRQAKGALLCCAALPLLWFLIVAVHAEPRRSALLPKPQTVGPGAIGVAPPSPLSKSDLPATALRDGVVYAFAKQIPAAASYDGFAVNGPHLLIENVAFGGRLDIYTKTPVVLRGVTVRVRHTDPFALLVRSGAGPVFVLYASVGAANENAPASDVATAIALHADHAVVYRSSVTGAADGIQIAGSRVRVVENIIRTRMARPGDHNDGIQLLKSPSDVEITRNRITNPNPETSCVMIIGSRIRVEENVLAGGGWSIYGGDDNNGHGGGSAKSVVVSNNVFKRTPFANGGHYGVAAYWNVANIWTANRFDDATAAEPAKPAKRPAKNR